ncbi:MAG: Flp pilus assembly complex ATPase component TadA [Thermotogae bacterium]|nr:Flp pilus assembly complex ATPase component TadA [Thermotogota bacterium]
MAKFKTYKRIGDILIEKGLITPEELKYALSKRGEERKPLGEVLVDLGLVTWDDIVKALGEQYGIPVLDKVPSQIPSDVVKSISKQQAEKLHIVPIGYEEDGTLSIVTDDVLRVAPAQEEIRFLTGKAPKILLVSKPAFEELFKRVYEGGAIPDLAELELEMGSVEQTTEEVVEEELTESSPAVKVVNFIIDGALKQGASDIHIEPQEHLVRVRYRVDGRLRKVTDFPKSLHSAVVSRIKILSKLDISERRLPQDGKFYVRREGEQYDFRVSTMPSIFGEKVVMRILKVSAANRRLEDLGLSEYNYGRLRELISHPYGIILVTGPTGSGKSTTLVGVLNELKDITKNIVTAEDPVEYTLDGITQCQVNPEIGLTFARYLRAFLRQDPDIIMVGEIRDRETAQLAIEASMTGHLVLSTLHTNTAPAAIARLMNMGVDLHLISVSLLGVVGQRLVRKLCHECRVRVEASDQVKEVANKLAELVGWKGEVVEYVAGEGCESCDGEGYKGRTAIHEILMVSKRIREMIVAGASESEIEKVARSEGMVTMYEDGVFKVMEGITSLEEVKRVAEAR